MGAIDAFNATIIVVDRLLSAFGSPSMFHRTRTIGNRKPDDMFAGTLVINSALDKTISEYPDGLRSLIGMYEHIAEYLCPEEEFSEAVPAHNKASRTLVWQTTREYYHSLPVVTMHEDIRAYFIGTLRGVRMFSTIRTSSHAGQSVLRGSDIYATYEQLVRLQNYLRTRGVEGEYEIDATRTFTVSPSGIQMRKCLVQSKWHEGKQQFLLDIETAWNDPTDILGIADTPGKNPVSRASNIARNLKNIRQASDQGELEGVRYRSD
ncbi:MAG TPA: hypothetical protein PK765_01820 [bacterium]|nr:hypothetical protein [bacterium]